MADYPPEIYLDPDTEERLISYIESELTSHYAERGSHVDDLMRWQKDYWATPQTKEATFPFKGAAIIIIPLSAIAVEAIHARTMTMLFGLPQFVSAHAISPAFAEVGYEKTIKWVVREVAGYEEEFPITVKDGVVIDSVPEARFMMPYSSQDPQSATWCGEEHSKTTYEVMMLEEAGMFRPGTIISTDPDPDVNNSKLGAWVANTTISAGTQQGGRFERNQEMLEKMTPVWPDRINWVEIWLPFDVNGSKRQREIVVHYHRESRAFMSIRNNWHSDVHRPYRHGIYFPIEHRWHGIGICKKNEQFQREVTTQHRQRLDNATLANMRMIVINKLEDYGPREPVFPGKIWFVNDIKNINTIQMGEIYPSSYQNEQATLIYSQQRTGVNETVLGMPQVGTPGTATSDLARIQEGNKKFDFIYGNFREFVEEIIVDSACIIQQFGPRRLSYFEHAENGQLVQQFFQMPAELIRDGVLITLRSAGQQQNKILDRTNWQQIAVHLQAYYQGLIQLAMPLGDQNLLRLIFIKGLGAATEGMRQILESFDTRNIDRLIVREIEEMLTNAGSQQAGAQPGAGGGTPGGPQGALPPAGMDFLNQAFSAVAPGGNGGAGRLR